MFSRFHLAGSGRFLGALPGRGILVVFRHQMRARCPVRDLIWMGVLVLSFEAIAAGLQFSVMPAREYSGDTPGFLHRWISMASLAGPLLFLPVAAALGALSVPPVSRFEETQSMLLTRLTPLDLCAGRLFAGLWPLIAAILASCAILLTVQLIWRPILAGPADGYLAIFVMHLVLLTSAVATGALAFLPAMRRRPGRVWSRGFLAALAAAALAVTGLFLANPILVRRNDPTGLIYGMLLINPVSASAAALHMDILRVPGLYERTNAHDYPFVYPPALGSCALFAAGAAVMLALSAARLRSAYR